jgi:hypothetical protein
MGLVVASLGAMIVAWAWRADREWFDTHGSPIYCAIDPQELRSWDRRRVAAAVAGALVVLALAPLAARWARRHSWRSGLATVARVVVAAVLALVLCDVVLRRKHEPAAAPGPTLLPPTDPDARYGWVNRPATTVLQVDGHDVVYAFNAHGDRVGNEHDMPDFERPTIVVTGESIAEALGIAWEDSFPAILEQRTGMQVIDLGVSAWGHDQAYVRAKDVLGELKRPLAVVTIVVTQQLQRDLPSTRKHLALGRDGALIAVDPAPEPEWWSSSPLRQLAQRIAPYHGDESIDVARAVIATTSREAHDHDVYPLFVLTNWGPACLPDDSGAPSVERRLFGGQGVRWVRVDLDPSWEDRTTHHPGPRSHRLIESAIEDALVDDHVIPPVAPGTSATGGPSQ